MPKIREDIIQHVIDSAKIEEVVGDFLTLRKTGVNMTCRCPFHDDHHDGNFIVRPSTIKPEHHGNTYRCFVCEAKGDAVKFLMEYDHKSFPDAIRWLGKKYNIEVDDVPVDWTPPPPREPSPPLPTLTLPRSMVAKRMNTQGDNLVEWIKNGIQWGNEQRARITKVIHDYCVGHSQVQGRHEFTVFWLIDADGNVRTAHYMKYHPSGHRVKEKRDYPQDWFHAMLARHYDPETREIVNTPPYPYPHIYDPDRQQARLCLFGEHLLKRYPNAAVKLVESEKTALLMAIAYGNHERQVWLACCGASNITRERLKPLIDQKRQIILYPDRDGVKQWQQRADGLYYPHISVDAEPVTKWWREEDGPKADIADVVVRMINQAPPPPKTIDEVRQQVPAMGKLIDNMNLTIDNNE